MVLPISWHARQAEERGKEFLLRSAQMVVWLLTTVDRVGQVLSEKQGGHCVRELSWCSPEPCASFAGESIPEKEGE
jgi:hypothetical protein